MQFPASIVLTGFAPTAARRADAGEIDRAVADVVVGVAAEILGRKFPVARHAPFLHAAQQFGLTLAAVPAVELQIEKPRERPEIFLERGRLRVPGREDRALV